MSGGELPFRADPNDVQRRDLVAEPARGRPCSKQRLRLDHVPGCAVLLGGAIAKVSRAVSAQSVVATEAIVARWRLLRATSSLIGVPPDDELQDEGSARRREW